MRHAFAPLRTRNYRLYFTGQTISLTGTWFVLIATGWLVLSLSHSGAVLGALIAAELLPSLLLGAYAGVVADRVNKRTLILADNVLAAVLSALLALACLTGTVTLWMVFAFGITLGVTAAFAQPAQQAFLSEMVSDVELKQAVTLNSMMGSVARTIGPACAGLLIVGAGVSACFALNALSYIAVFASFARMRSAALTIPERVVREPGQLREGLHYVRSRSQLLWPLLMMALVGTFAYEFAVTLPLMAKALHGSASTYGLMTAAMGVGSVAAGLLVNHKLTVGLRSLCWLSLAFGASIALAALAPSILVELGALVLVGAASTAFMATTTSSLQLAAAPLFRGRVMGLAWVANAGSTPVGAPVVGVLAALEGARAGLLLGAGACALSAAVGFAAYRRAPLDTTTAD
jgi:MFS family permease